MAAYLPQPMDGDLLSAALSAISFAPLGGGWDSAIAAISSAVGGWCSQLFEFAPDGALLSFVSYNVDHDLERQFLQAGGVDPARNPRARIIRREPMIVLPDAALATPEEIQSDPFYDFFRRIDAPHVALARVPLVDGKSAVMAVLRSAREGMVDGDHRRQFQQLLPVLHATLKLQERLGSYSADLCRAVLEAVRMPAILLDRRGRVLSISPSAESLFATGGVLRIRFGMVEATDPTSDQALRTCLTQATAHPPLVGRMVLRGPVPVVAEVAPLNATTTAFDSGARVILAFPSLRRAPGNHVDTLRSAFHLSVAEAEIALQLSRSVTPIEIALGRGVSLATIRQQIKALHTKCGVRDRASLVRTILTICGPEPLDE